MRRGSWPATRRSSLAPGALALGAEVDQGSLELEIGRQLAPALERVIEPSEADDRPTQFLLREVRGLAEDLLDVERVALQRRRCITRPDPLRRQTLAAAHERDVVAEGPRQPRRRVAAGPSLPLEDRLGRAEGAPQVAPGPRVGELERGCLGHRGHELLDLALADRLAAGPEGELVDLARELLEVVADELDQRGRGAGLGLDSRLLEALRHPGID